MAKSSRQCSPQHCPPPAPSGGNHTPNPAQRNLETNYILGHPWVPTQAATHELFGSVSFHLDASRDIPGTLCHSNELRLAHGHGGSFRKETEAQGGQASPFKRHSILT